MSGPECCSNPPTLNPSGGAGHVDKLAGLDTYFIGSPDSKLAVVLVSDVFGISFFLSVTSHSLMLIPFYFIAGKVRFHANYRVGFGWGWIAFGYEAPNLRKLADKVAADGYYVVVPDLLDGEPLNLENPNRTIPAWLKDHGPDKGFEATKPIIEALKNKGVSAIGAVGFCWGAKVVVELAKSRLIQAAVLLHPTFVTLDDIKGVDIPISILGAEIDNASPPELVKQFEQVLTAKSEVDSFVKIFPKVSHGWSMRYDPEDAETVKAAEEAHQDLLNWFAKHLK
ncbi:Dienelactone hydrolase [Sesbania bispinosa]|nr:Dienelactone hydrolase [Sesbania bispinosa]